MLVGSCRGALACRGGAPGGSHRCPLWSFVQVIYVVVDVVILLSLHQLGQVRLVLVQLSVSRRTDALELTVKLDAVGVKVFVETFVLRKGGPLPAIRFVFAQDNPGNLLAWQRLVDIVKVL